MNRVLTALLIGMLAAAANAQVKSDREQDRLLGPVQTVRTEVVEFTTRDGKSVEGQRMPMQTVTYDARGNRIKRIDFNRDGSVAQTLIYNYDTEGRSTGYEDFTPGLTTPRKHVYVLEPDGKRSEYKIIQPTGSAADEKYLYKYDARGNKVAEALYHKSALISRNENAYDDQGRLISQVIYNPDGSIFSTIRNRNDPEGKPIERVRHDGDLLTYRVRYTYDVKGRLVGLETVGSFVETDSSSEGYVTGKVVYLYKGKDHPKETVTYDQDGSLRERVVFVYDSRGNWIKRTRLVQAGLTGKEVPLHTEYRTITYHRQSALSEEPGLGPRRLVWSDEFDYTGLPDSTKWGYDVGDHGWGNKELQNYTGLRKENARVESGRLIIEARRDGSESHPYTSARLVSKGKGDWTYGRFEVRAKLPSGRGTWPAIWMLPSLKSYGNGSWPDNGEIDVMEHVGSDPDVVHGSAHTRAFYHSIGTQKTGKIEVRTSRTGFNVYAVEWTPQEIRWYVNDQHYFTFRNERLTHQTADYRQWPFDKPFHLILNIAVGGTWGGSKGIDDSIWPQRMEVDYVRIYRAP